MRLFLREIASDLVSDYGDSLADHCVVFPNNRSIIFFRKYLSEIIDKPMFMPSLQTITTLIEGQSKLRKAEPVQLVFELYKTFIDSGSKRDTPDEFYYWGEMLLNDFDDIDKYLVDAAMLFSNMADLKEIDRKFGGLEDEVLEIIRQFWINFDASRMTAEKADFLSLWEVLPSVYDNFRKRLEEKGLAYEGMIIREQAERLKGGTGGWCEDIREFHFVGFNALNMCERIILKQLQRDKRARFYWDYDPSYVDDPNHEAGHFIRQNLSDLGDDKKKVKEERQPKARISIYSAPSDVSQAKLIPSITGRMDIKDDPNDTAVILADENLLSPVLNSLPGAVANINITMGYPLYQTPVYSLVHQLLNLQRNKRNAGDEDEYYYGDVVNILQHQYIVFRYPDDSGSLISRIREDNVLRVSGSELGLNDLFKKIFVDGFSNRTYITSILHHLTGLLESSPDNEKQKKPGLNLQQEYIYSLILPLNQLTTVLADSGMDPGVDLYTRLVDRVMRSIVIPFSGEPLQGLQVMGILETRALDFRNIILLSANEGRIPKSPPANSYIPFNLREAFGLPTIKHSDSIYAYYFYRLLQRSENVNLVYNSSTDGMRSGEMSRFLLQLKYDEKYNEEFLETRYKVLPVAKIADSIKRNNEISRTLRERFLDKAEKKQMSPSAINTWLSCNMRFYYRYIAGIKEAEEILEEVDSPAFGNILHQVMKDIYTSSAGRLLEADDIEELLKNKSLISGIIERAFRREFMKNSRAGIRGRNLVITSILERMAVQILKKDRQYAPFRIISLEKKYHMPMPLVSSEEKPELIIGGTIDRIDEKNGRYRVLDYKSGADSTDIGNLDQLFDYEYAGRNSAAFQTLLYCEIYRHNNNADKDIRPSLYPVRKIFSEGFSDVFNVKKGDNKGQIFSYADIRDHFLDGLGNVLSDIFDIKRDINMTTNRQKCITCPYNSLCSRQELK